MIITTNTSDGALIVTNALGVILSASGKIGSILGFAPGDLVGQSLATILASPYAEQQFLFLQLWADPSHQKVCCICALPFS